MCSYGKNKHEVTKTRIRGVRERGNGSHVWLSALWDHSSEQFLTSSILPLALLCCKEIFILLCVCVNTDVSQELYSEDLGVF